MQQTGNTILVTGGGSGIGRGLAEAWHAAGNRVVIAGRREAALREVAEANPGLAWMTLDIADKAAIRAFAATLAEAHPALNVVVNNAGVMRPEALLSQPAGLEDAEAIVTTNLLGPIRLTAALLPHLKQQARATVINVSSGLAFVPLAMTPTYSATKAAIHSYTQSMRYQLKDTAIEVLELAPPYVQTDLMSGRDDPRAMPLKDFIAEVMDILKAVPPSGEICVERVGTMRNAERNGRFDATFKGLNDAMNAGH